MIGVMTCPRTDGVDYLPETLRALDAEGSDKASVKIVSVDGKRSVISYPGDHEHTPWQNIQYKHGPSGTIPALFRLVSMAVDNDVDAFLLCEDDILPCKNAVEKMLHFPIPEEVAFVAFIDMHIFARQSRSGLYRLRPVMAETTKQFWGHQAVLFPRRTLRALLKAAEQTSELINRWKNSSDGMLGDLMERGQLQSEYACHIPCLVDHIGKVSRVFTGQSKHYYHSATNFAGKDFDALSLSLTELVEYKEDSFPKPHSVTTPTLSLTMIVRDVAGYIRPALESVLPYVDEVVIGDTGEPSERATTRPLIEALCREHNKPLRYAPLGPDTSPDLFTQDTADTWAALPLGEFASAIEDLKEFSGDTILSNFGLARQATLNAATSDYVIWIDSDDLVENASKLPALLRHMAAKALDSVLLEYDYEHNEDGHVTTRVSRARVFRRQGPCQWTFPIHEVLTPLGNSEMLRSEDDSPQVRIVHRAAKLTKQFSKSVRPPMRNYKVLLQELSRQLVANKHDKTKINPRIWFYLGNESRAFNPKLSIQFFEQYIATTTFPEEKALAHVYIGQMREGDGQLLEAQGHYATASCIFPRKPEAHFGLARIAHYLGDDQNCIHHHRQGEIAVHHKEDALHYNPFDRIVYPAICDGPAFLRTGQYKKALRLADAALSLAPKSAHLLALKSRAEKEILKRWRPRKIYLWTGNALETWTPDNLDTQGIGGSETAAVHMARELAALGHDVTVFSNCGDKQGHYDGVKYVHFEHLTQGALFNGLPVECDLFISSRRVHLFPINAAKKILWMHDTYVGPPTQDICQKLLQFDHVLALSQWHKAILLSVYPFIDPSRVLVTTNGIDLERYREPPAKIGNRLIYSSSPDRGLALLLELFPAIKDQVSDAELHVYYGFYNYEKIIERNAHDPQMQEYARHEIATIREAMANTRGVIYHGRVGQKELARAQLAAKVAAYPTHFSETSCQLEGSLVFTKSGMRPIESIHEGDLVLTHKGRFRQVTKIIKRHYEDQIYSLKRKKDFNPIVVTKEHPLYVATFHKRADSKGNRVYSKAHTKVNWVSASKARVDMDYLLSPKMEFGNLKKILISDYVNMPVTPNGLIGRNPNQKRWGLVKNEVMVTPELMYILGLYAAEGCASSAKKRKADHQWFSQIVFALHLREVPLANKIIKFFDDKTSGSRVRRTSKNGMSVVTHSSPWANFFSNVIGKKREKKIPTFVWDCSRENQNAFIQGLFDGDGNTSISKKGYRSLVHTTISPSLAYGLAQLLANQGMYPSVGFSKKRKAYCLSWSENPGPSKQHREIQEGYATRIKKIDATHYSGHVYNFEVEEDHSYVTDRTIVHNCITMMENQAAGCTPVTTELAALPETVHHGFLLKPPNTAEAYKAAFIKRVVWCLTHEEERAGMASRGRTEAFKLHSWKRVAEEWDDMFARMFDPSSSRSI